MTAMQVIVLGHRGMLGTAVVDALRSAGHDPIPSVVNVRDGFDLRRLDDEYPHAKAVINCAGVIPDKHRSTVLTITTNALGPHLVAKSFRCHVVNVSTDCVFSGRRKEAYTTNDLPDPDSLYGRSKLLGEVEAPHVTTVRTSFVGLRHGIVKWFLSQEATEDNHPAVVPGWLNAWWTGSTVYEVAKRLVEIAEADPRGLTHLATEQPITKYDLLIELQRVFGRGDIRVERVRDVRGRYRNLAHTYFLKPFAAVSQQLLTGAV